MEGVGDALFVVESLSPVKSNLLNASTSKGTLLTDVDDVVETIGPRTDCSFMALVRGVCSTSREALENGFDGMVEVRLDDWLKIPPATNPLVTMISA